MKVLVFEDNLMWSPRLVRSLTALGHEAEVRDKFDPSSSDAQLAIVNLGSDRLRPKELVPLLENAGILTIGHAGHKETQLLDLGRESGCTYVATNSELTYKLPEILTQYLY